MRILNFGSLNIDTVYQVEHFVRAGETLASQHREQFPGGKGLNQSLALAKAGANVFHAGKIGADGIFLKELLEQWGINTDFIQICDDLPSGHAVIQVTPKGENGILLFHGANGSITEQMIQQVLEPFGPGDWLLLQNEINGLPQLLRFAHEKGLQIALNPSPITDTVRNAALELTDCLIFNEIEGQELSGVSTPTEILTRLHRDLQIPTLLLTLGKDGAILSEKGKQTFQPIFSVPTVDTTAAGDTFTGYFLANYINHLSPDFCLETAAVAAALAVSRKGAAPSIPTAKEVKEAQKQFRQQIKSYDSDLRT